MTVERPTPATPEANGSHRPPDYRDDEAVAVLVHDLRNFFHSVQMSVCLLKSTHDSDDRLCETLDVLERDSKSALPQLNELVAFARGRRDHEDHSSRRR